MSKAILLLTLALSFSAHAEETKLTQCFSRVAVRGKLDAVDTSMKRISGIFLVFNKVHTPLSKEIVVVDAIIAVAGVGEKDLPSMLSDEWVKRIFTMTGVLSEDVTTKFLGCSDLVLRQ